MNKLHLDLWEPSLAESFFFGRVNFHYCVSIFHELSLEKSKLESIISIIVSQETQYQPILVNSVFCAYIVCDMSQIYVLFCFTKEYCMERVVVDARLDNLLHKLHIQIITRFSILLEIIASFFFVLFLF